MVAFSSFPVRSKDDLSDDDLDLIASRQTTTFPSTANDFSHHMRANVATATATTSIDVCLQALQSVYVRSRTHGSSYMRV
jgi:glycerol-3-phosphate O-acyltransferase